MPERTAADRIRSKVHARVGSFVNLHVDEISALLTERDESLAYAAELGEALQRVTYISPEGYLYLVMSVPYDVLDSIKAVLNLTPPAALDEQRKREAEIRREVARECMEIADARERTSYWDEPSAGIAATIRQRFALDNPSGPCADDKLKTVKPKRTAVDRVRNKVAFRLGSFVNLHVDEIVDLLAEYDELAAKAKPKEGSNA